MAEFDIGVVLGYLDHHITPQLGGFQHVHLVDGADLLAALLGCLEGHMPDTTDLVFVVDHRVAANALAVFHGNPARFAEIDAACQLTHNQDIQAGHDFGLERGGIRQFRVENRRTQVGKQVQILADPQQATFRALRARQHVPLRATHGCQQHGIGCACDLARGFRVRVACGVHRTATQQGFLELQLHAFATEHFKHAQRFGHDFRADPVTGQNTNLHD